MAGTRIGTATVPEGERAPGRSCLVAGAERRLLTALQTVAATVGAVVLRAQRARVRLGGRTGRRGGRRRRLLRRLRGEDRLQVFRWQRRCVPISWSSLVTISRVALVV
jgi:hypothetical protein